MPEEMSTIDIKILEQIQKDCSNSTSELADRVGLSQSPCWRRLQRLKDEGYIRRQVAILDRSKFGSNMFILATLKMATLTDEKRAEFLRKVELSDEILECYTIFGERDIMMKIIAPSLPWYQNFVFKFILKLPGVQDVQSTVTLTELKHTTAIPLRGDRIL
jgi:Lrp/AsnC family transcriptional regulator